MAPCRFIAHLPPDVGYVHHHLVLDWALGWLSHRPPPWVELQGRVAVAVAVVAAAAAAVAVAVAVMIVVAAAIALRGGGVGDDRGGVSEGVRE